MSKKKKAPAGNKRRSKVSAGQPPKAAPKVEASSPEQLALYRKVFRFSALGILLITLLLSLFSGINGDDEFQNDYSEKLVNYYLSFGADTSALYIEKGNMHYYGGFFDLATGLVNRALGFEEVDMAYHHVRHLFNAIMGVLAMLFVGLLAKEIAGWRAGILALWFIFLSPRFLGHALMNPKDIPFAAGFAIATYYMVLLFKQMPRPGWKTALGVALGIALALATRAGGLLLFGYLGLFAGLDFLLKYGFKGLAQESKALLAYLAYGLGIAVAAYVLAILTWPAALADPLGHPLAALTEFSKLGIKIRVLFAGDNLLSDDTAWYYSVLWIVKTVPLFTLLGFAGSFFILPTLLKRYNTTAVLLAYFATIFPVAYVIYQDSILHDGWRHLMFIYPSMVVVAAVFWATLESFFQGRKTGRYVLWGVIGLLAVDAALFIVRNPQYPYVYFNPIGGGIRGAYGYYETDYWGVSVRQAIDWMAEEGILSPEMQDTVTLGTTFFYNASRLTRKRFNGKVKVKYVRFNTRYSEAWDYGIFPSRFIRGAHLRSGTWPNSKTIHTIDANGVPLLAIEKDENKYAFQGQRAMASGNLPEAVSQFQKEVQAHPDNEVAWTSLASAYISQGQYQQALEAAQRALQAAPDVETGLLYEGLAYLNLGQQQRALGSFERLVRVNEEYYAAYYYMGLAYESTQNYRAAFENAQKAIEANPGFKQAYQLAARALQALGDNQNAARYLEAAQKL
ncbi:MAG: tetratricopeptide repeat protein [Lewinellaceae bacterium]|nr:tetratricopeptide repeat protein [Phaeodactylibacter sp.]MCB9040544.1 tetratricopeptide repeat protein [Lewinellaceae bacterium]